MIPFLMFVLRLFVKFVFRPTISVIIGRAVLNALHANGYFPELQVGKMLTDIPQAFQTDMTWITAAIIGGALLFVWHFFQIEKRLEALGKRKPSAKPSLPVVPTISIVLSRKFRKFRKWRWVPTILSIVIVLFASAYGMHRYEIAQCRASFAFLPKPPEYGHYAPLDKPSKTIFARVVPGSDRRYFMKIFGDGDDLWGLAIKHAPRSGVPPDPSPWQRQPTGIGYRANYPVGDIEILIVANEPDKVTLDKPEFGCIE